MRRWFGLRARLTLFVAVVFSTALVVTAVLGLGAVERELIADTRASAEVVLGTYLESIYGGAASVGVVDSTETTRFFYRDSAGNEISEVQYFETLSLDFEQEFGALLITEQIVTGPIAVGEAEFVWPAYEPEPIRIDPDTGELLAPDGSSVAFSVGPRPVGEPVAVDVGPDVVAVSQTLELAAGDTLTVGVSRPLQPVTDSLATIRNLLWFGVPALVAAVAFITWLAATRALAPVQAITGRAQVISATNLGQRVPVNEADGEIRELATTMNNMLARLESGQRRQQQLVADASHELRSPVAASRAQLEVAAANPNSTDWAATATAVLAEQEQLGRLIDDLLALSRLDEAGVAKTQAVDLDELIVSEAKRVHPIEIRVAIATPIRVAADPALVTRALRNLVDNAARHARTDVLVSMQAENGNAVIDVDDDGAGVPVEQRALIFERFARLDEARDRPRGGAGLGLAIAHDVARAHHGDLVVAESPLGGARFRLTIPCRPSR